MCLKIAFTFIGTIIGAGFASGREISLYFGRTSLITVLISSLLLGVFCFVFLEIGRLKKSDAFSIFSKTKCFFSLTIKIFSFISLCAMISGGGEIINSLFSIKFGQSLTAILVLVTYLFGVEKVKLVNTILVPFIIIFVVVVAFFNRNIPLSQNIVIFPSIIYASMNIISGGYFVSTMSKNLTQKQNISISIIVTIFIGILLVLIYFSVSNNHLDSMPMISVANTINLGFVAKIVIFIAIFTTAIGCISIIFPNKKALGSFTLTLSLGISALPFSFIVNTFYPIIGYVGAVITILCIVKYIKLLILDDNVLKS